MQIGQYLPTSFPNPINFVKGHGRLCAIVALALVVIACLARKRSPSLSAHAKPIVKPIDIPEAEVEKIRAFHMDHGITRGDESLQPPSEWPEFKGKSEWSTLNSTQIYSMQTAVQLLISACNQKMAHSGAFDPVQKRHIVLVIGTDINKSWVDETSYGGTSKMERICHELVKLGIIYSAAPNAKNSNCWDIQA